MQPHQATFRFPEAFPLYHRKEEVPVLPLWDTIEHNVEDIEMRMNLDVDKN